MFQATSLFTLCFFNDTATTEIYTLSLHDALPILYRVSTSTRSPTLNCGFWFCAEIGADMPSITNTIAANAVSRTYGRSRFVFFFIFAFYLVVRFPYTG